MIRKLLPLFFSVAILIGMAGSAFATDVTVSSFNVPGYNYGGTTAKLRIYANMAWTDSTNIPHIAGVAGSATGFFQTVSCTVSGTTLQIPSFVIPSTTNAIVNRQVRLTAVIFDSNNRAHEQLFTNWFIPYQINPTSWAILVTDNAATQKPLADTYDTSARVDAKIAAAIGTGSATVPATDAVAGKVKLDVPAADAANPRVYGTNSPNVYGMNAQVALMTFSSTPTFDADTYGVFAMTLTGNVTSSSITYANAVAGRFVTFTITQDSTGSRTFTWPTTFTGAPTVTAAAGSTTSAMFYYNGFGWRATTSNSTPSNGGSGVINAADYGLIADGSSHPLSGAYSTLALAQAAYPFITALTQEIDYAATKQAANVALGADQAGTFHTPDTNSTLSVIKDSVNIVADDSLIGRTLLFRYPNGLTLQRTVTSNTAIAGIENIGFTPALPYEYIFDGVLCFTPVVYPNIYECSQYAIADAGEHGFTNARLNKPLFLPGGNYVFGDDTLLIRNASGANIYGAGRTATILTSNTTVFATDGLWYSQITGLSFKRLTGGTGRAVDIDGEVPGHPYATRTVQANTFKDIDVDGGLATEGMYLCRQGGGNAQCSENLFLNVHLQRADTLLSVLGSNALNTTFIGGNFQDFLTGAFFNGGSAVFMKTGFQSTRGYLQVAAGGADIDASTFGVNDTIQDIASDSESLVHYKGGFAQIAYVQGLAQRCGSCLTRANNTAVSLNNIYQSTVDASLLYRVTTAGTTAGSLPVFGGATTVTDGTAVWTVVPFESNHIPAGYADGIDGLRGPGRFAAAVRQNARTVEVNGLSAYQVPLDVEHVLVNAASANVTVTLPATFFKASSTYGARVTVSQYAGVSQAGHTVMITAQAGIEGGDYTLPGTGGGAATFINNGGGDLQLRYYRVGGTDARTLNGATFAVPGAIGGTTPAAGTFAALISTSGALNGTLGAGTPNTVAATSITASTTLGVTGVTTPTGGIAAAGGFSFSPRLISSCGISAITSTQGTDSTPVNTETYIVEVYVPANATVTGVALLNGSAVAGNVKISLATSAGAPIAGAVTASTAQTGTAVYQLIPFAVAYAAKGPAIYYVLVQFDTGTTPRFRTHAFGVCGASKKTGEVYGTFTSVTPPTTFTTGLGPVLSLY